MLFLNGSLDFSYPEECDLSAGQRLRALPDEGCCARHAAVVCELVARRAPHFERLAVDSDDFDRFRDGDKIVVGVEPGALGIPWFYGVYHQ